VISAGEKDGIYLWQFYGDTQTQFAYQAEPYEEEEEEVAKTKSQGGGILERLRTGKKEAKLM